MIRQAAKRKAGGGRQVSTTSSGPAPVGGWNARDALANMDPKDAIILDNWFPAASDVFIRNGHEEWSTGLDSLVDALMAYRPANSLNNEFFAASGTEIHDITVSGAVGAAVVSGLTNGRFQYVNMSTSGGKFLIAVNGVDSLLNYDGTTWVSVTGVSSHAITGVTTANLIGVNIFKERLFFIEKNSTKTWYLGVGAIAGAVSSFDVGPMFKQGGYLMAMGTWTLDGGIGIDDYAVFISSEGEAIVYRGTDPGSASTWAMVGVYHIGTPIGRRCMIKYAGDLLIITNDGVIPASRAFVSARTNGRIAFTDKIQYAMSRATSLYSENFGWSLSFYPGGSALILNVPTKEGTEQQQYVMNSVTGAWCRFTGWEANCFEIFNGELYFGGNAKVYKAWTSTSDNGDDIVSEVVTAFSYFGYRSYLKDFKLIQPIISWDAAPSSFLVGIDVDYKIQTPQGEISIPGVGGSLWDTGLWDSAIWGGGSDVIGDWQSISGNGYAASVHIKISSSLSEIRWSAFNIAFENGGIL